MLLAAILLLFSVTALVPQNTMVAEAYTSHFLYCNDYYYFEGSSRTIQLQKGFGSVNWGNLYYRSSSGGISNSNVAAAVSFSSSNKKVATIGKSSGILKIKATGVTKITTKCGSKKDVIRLKVVKNDSKFSSAKKIVTTLTSLDKTYGKLNNLTSETQARKLMNSLSSVLKSATTLSKSYKFNAPGKTVLDDLTIKGQNIIPNRNIYQNLHSLLREYQSSALYSSNIGFSGKSKTITLSCMDYSGVKTAISKDMIFSFYTVKAGQNLTADPTSYKGTYNIYKYCSKCGSYHSDEVYTTATGTIKSGSSTATLTTRKALTKGVKYYIQLGNLVREFTAN